MFRRSRFAGVYATLLRSLDEQRGIYLSSGYEYPGRYSRWDIASTCPPLEIVAFGREVEFRPLNERGTSFEPDPAPRLAAASALGRSSLRQDTIVGPLETAAAAVSPKRSAASSRRYFRSCARWSRSFATTGSRLALVGAFGYDLLFQFDPIELQAAARAAQGPAPLPLRRHLLHGSQEGADRALSVRLRRAAI